MYLSRYLKIYPSKERPDYYLIYSTLRSAMALVSGSTLSVALSGSKLGPEGETLRKLGMLVDHPSLEREQMRTLLERANNASRRLKAIVVLNLDCNLDCSYCYEGEFRRAQYMSDEILELLVQTLLRDRMAAGMDVSLSFYGGEPLLSVDLIHRISEPLLEGASRYGVKYQFDLVTNGTLLNRRTAEELVPLGLKAAKFTLDGPREIHDRQRPFISGAGSFDAIVDNMAEVWDLVRISLGGNFRVENYKEFPRLLDHLLERGITPEKIARVVFTPVTPKSGCAEHGSECASSSEPWLVEAIPYLRQEIVARGFAAQAMKASACIVEFTNTLVINYDGTLYKCPAFMGWDGFSIGSLGEGISDYSASHGMGNWQNDQCLDCPYLPLCFGGCRFLNLLKGRDIGDLDCRREFLDATLERFILQNIPRTAKEPAPPEVGAEVHDYCI